MNDQIRKQLEDQRKWRETKTVPKKFPHPALALPAIIFAVMVLYFSIMLYGICTASVEALPVQSTPESKAARIATLVPAPLTMTVCTGNLNVRYTPNGSVRGYLKAGETIELKLDANGKSITQTIEHENWTLVSSPVAGWANTKYLCKTNGGTHDRN
jgi:hypothetical protein